MADIAGDNSGDQVGGAPAVRDGPYHGASSLDGHQVDHIAERLARYLCRPEACTDGVIDPRGGHRNDVSGSGSRRDDPARGALVPKSGVVCRGSYPWRDRFRYQSSDGIRPAAPSSLATLNWRNSSFSSPPPRLRRISIVPRMTVRMSGACWRRQGGRWGSARPNRMRDPVAS